MALIKNIQTKYGIEAGYWRVETITIDNRLTEANFVIHLYLNKEATQSFDYRVITIADKENKEELFNRYFSPEYPYENVYNACYELAKELDDFFKDAIDG